MKRGFVLFLLSCLILTGSARAQYGFLTSEPEGKRLQALWRHCSYNSISDKDPATVSRFLQGVEEVADSLGDKELKKYAQYFRLCGRMLFSTNYKQYFKDGDYESQAAVFKKAGVWAVQAGHPDITAVCEHYVGEVYFIAARYGLAFEHLLKADDAFRKIGYANIPGIANYLYNLGRDYYRFEEWDKALHYFLLASQYPFYLPRVELNTLNSIGLIYAQKEDWDSAILFFRRTIKQAVAYEDTTWVGIASGNLGNVFLKRRNEDSALFYHRQNWNINNYYINPRGRAPEDAAKSALVMASVFVQKLQPDSALFYLDAGKQLATNYITDVADKLEYRRRMLAVQQEYYKTIGNFGMALQFSDSLSGVKDSLRQLLNGNLINRATGKAEAERYGAEIKLLQSEKALGRLRVYVLSGILIFSLLTAGVLFNRYRARQRRQDLWAQKEKELLSLDKMRTEEKLLHAEELLKAYLVTIREKNALVDSMSLELDWLKETAGNDDHLRALAGNMEKLFSATILTESDWSHFRGLFQQVHPGFLSRLIEKFPELSPAETRLLILTKLNLSSREMANMLGVSIDAIRKLRYRLRKKLNLDREENLENAIMEL